MSLLLSIVTINYNDVKGLKRTLESVAQQSCCGFEHIIIDGGSTDGSPEVIKEYVSRLQDMQKSIAVRWISEPDKGIYNAMNKGILMAKGDYIEILNSGDALAAADVVERMIDALEQNAYPEIMYGNMVSVSPDGKIVAKSGRTEYSLRNYFSGTLNHDCAYIKRHLFDESEYGLYDESLKIVSDWKWYLQTIGLGRVEPVYVDIDVTLFDVHGISSQNLELRNAERRQVLEQLLPPAVLWDYDHHAFDAVQMNRLRRHHLYPLVYLIERTLFKLEKWKILKP